MSLRDVVFPGLRWVVGDGRDIKFWEDSWLRREPLIMLATGDIPMELRNLRIRDLWTDGIGWDLSRIEPFVTNELRLNLLAMVVDTVTGSRDRLAWGLSNNGEFTVKSAYALLTSDLTPRMRMEGFFNRIWQVKVPERIRVFFWLVANQVIMTNSERHRRHLSDSSICVVCKGGEETILHVLRDCPAISGIWNRVVPRSKRQLFFSQSLLEWLYGNLGDDGICENVPWEILFGMVSWWSWKWRCGNVFGENGKCRDRVRFVKDLALEVNRANTQSLSGSAVVTRVDRLIAWGVPRLGWVKLNTDGASHGNPGLATAGGVLRDSNGRWIQGFALNIGSCSAPLAELWGVYYGLYIAWEQRIPRIELEVDSEMVVSFLKTGISETHPLSFLVRLCYDFLSKDWEVHISHSYREANRLADGLANYAFSLSLGFHLFESCPDCIYPILGEDTSGTAIARRVRL